MMTARDRMIDPSERVIANPASLCWHTNRAALRATAISAPNFCACARPRAASAWPEMPVGKPR